MGQTKIHWNSDEERELYSMGNGQLCVYECGVNIDQIFGPPLSTPSYMKAILYDREKYQIESERQEGTAIWHHTIIDQQGEEIGKICDFVASNLPCFVRICELKFRLTFGLELNQRWSVTRNRSRFQEEYVQDAFLAYAKAGISVYEQACYPSVQDLSHQFILMGEARLEENLTLVMETGTTVWYSVGGMDYPECVRNTEQVLQKRPVTLLNETEKMWQSFWKTGEDVQKLIPDDLPGQEELQKTLEDVAVLIKTQQAQEGAVIAGHNFHMAYVRDQFGVFRGLLQMGFLIEARKMLEFYAEIFQKYGVIHNAQTIGHSHYFHIHENDDVEITGYLIIQAFDYLKAGGDREIVRDLLPMLQWAWRTQVYQIHENMLPFNGDETYVAGGILPRYFLGDASAEATLLFLASGERLLPFVAEENYWDRSYYDKQQSIYEEVKRSYKKNFVFNSRLMANKPYQNGVTRSRFLHGVCMQCHTYGWIEKSTQGRYLCHRCIVNPVSDILPENGRKEIISVQMMPFFIGTDLFEAEEFRFEIEDIAKMGLPEKIIGYDRGILLENLTFLKSPLCHQVYQELLHSADHVGGWSEFYQNGRATGTRYRPWESGINITSLLKYAKSYKEIPEKS